MEHKTYYNIKEAACILDVSRNSIYAWRDNGTLIQEMVGVIRKKPHITASSIEKLLQQAGYRDLEQRLDEMQEGQPSVNNRTPLRVAA